MMRRVTILALLAVPLLLGCGRKATKALEDLPQAVAASVAADDMCAEHGVLEVLCTKCHPKLIPVFQAKGDWCAEHGFPMSVCPTHHPERGGRPLAAVAIDEAPASGTKVRFKSLAVARDAGIETVAALPGREGASVVATATLVADASHLAVVHPRVAGVVREIRADLGARVARGTPLAELESAAVGEDRSRLMAGEARATAAEAAARREQELYEKGVSALREVEEARREWEAAKAEVAAARSALGITGTSAGTAGIYVLRAPIAGVVTRRAATVGTLVDPDDALFEIVDVSGLWAELDVPEAQASRVRAGQRVLLRVEGVPGREFEGRVTFVSPVIDPRTRTARARAALSNRDGSLRANMFARARILDEAGVASVLVPGAAVQEARGAQVVFVQLAPDLYETRRVRTLPAANGMVAIAADLKAGERVVTTGSFLLKTETLKESIGAGCCEVEPPSR